MMTTKIFSRTFALCLILIVMGCALVFSQVGADKRPPTPPKTSTPKTPTKRTQTTRRPATHSAPSSTSSSTPRQALCDAHSPTRGTGREYSENLNGVRLEMVEIPQGSFCMGSPNGVGEDNEHPQHQVTVNSFYIGKYEITQAQYMTVVGNNPSHFKGDNLPVETVSWDDAVEFCKRLSRMTGREYRLPTEAEWEYACRAGTTGDYAGNLDSMGWDFYNSGEQTHTVGQKQPNSFGLYDMHGNVWEWCEDLYHGNYNGAPADGSAWLSGEGGNRIQRGGAWKINTFYNIWRSASRYGGNQNSGDYSSGFRVVAVSRS
jgi:formylglycine-generating enzyme required for sulfatase activity